MPKRLGFIVMAALVVSVADPSWGITVTPGRTEIRLSPGKKIRGQITATNNGQELQRVTVSTKDWFMLEANKAKDLTVDRWLRVHGPKEFELRPGQSRTVRYTVTCPKEAQGELVGMVSFLHTKEQPSMVNPMISVSVYLAAAGTEQLAGHIQELIIRRWNNQVQGAVAVKSTGNIHLRPMGTLIIQDAAEKEIGRFEIRQGGPAYPGQSQGYFAQIPQDFELLPGRYATRAELEFKGLSLQAQRGFTVKKDGQIELDPA